jgi:hypothetical protein
MLATAAPHTPVSGSTAQIENVAIFSGSADVADVAGAADAEKKQLQASNKRELRIDSLLRQCDWISLCWGSSAVIFF